MSQERIRIGFILLVASWLLVALLAIKRSWTQSNRSEIRDRRWDRQRHQGLAFITHHKTGTAAIGCIVGSISTQLDLSCQHSALPIYVNEGLTPASVGFYAEIARVAAIERFGTVADPFLLLKTGTGPDEVCYDTASLSRGASELRLNSEHPRLPGRICPGMCPCHNGVSNCLEIGSCHAAEPFMDLLWVHVIRRPLDVVLSAYAYHIQDPAPESWLKLLSIRHYALYLSREGADNATLKSLGVYRRLHARTSYWRFLRALPEDKGVILEFLRSSAELWQSARLHLRFSRMREAITVRYEDLAADPRKALMEVTEAVSTPCMAKHEDELWRSLMLTCHTGSWSASRLANSSHVGKYSATDRLRRARILMSNSIARDHLMRLESVLEYDPDISIARMFERD